METLKETLKGDWKAEKRSKYIYPLIDLSEDVPEAPEDMEGEIVCVQVKILTNYNQSQSQINNITLYLV